MDTKHLRAAIAVACHGSFTRAARELYMAQSTLSRQVIALERHLGTELFVRGLRSVVLTDDGRAFLPEAERVLEAVARAERAARARLADQAIHPAEPQQRPAALPGGGGDAAPERLGAGARAGSLPALRRLPPPRIPTRC